MGFHIYGVAVSGIILLPNLFFFLFPPRNMPEHLEKEPLVLTILENIGRFSCFLYPLTFGASIAATQANVFLYLMIVCVLLYYTCWMRYFAGGYQYSLLFRPFWRIPIPMAVFPFLYFCFLAIWLKSPLMGIASFLFGLGHIPISLRTGRQIGK